MTRKFYLFAIFMIPAVLLLLALADRILPMDFPAAFAGLLAACVFTGFRAPRRGDWFLGALIPLALFTAIFLANFLSDGESTAPFDLVHALKQSTRPEFLIEYLSLGAAAFAASLRKR